MYAWSLIELMSAADKPVEDLESHFWPHSCPLANLFVDIVFTSSIQQLSFEFVVNIFIKLEFVAIVFIKLEFVATPTADILLIGFVTIGGLLLATVRGLFDTDRFACTLAIFY